MNPFLDLILPILICSVVIIGALFTIIWILRNDGTPIWIGISGLIILGCVAAIIAGSVNYSKQVKQIKERVYLTELSYKGVLNSFTDNGKDFEYDYEYEGYVAYLTLPYKDSVSSNEQFTIKFNKYHKTINHKVVATLSGTVVNSSIGGDMALTVTSFSSNDGTTQNSLTILAKKYIDYLSHNLILDGMYTRYYTTEKSRKKDDKTIDVRKYGIFPNSTSTSIESYLKNHKVW